MSATLFVGYRMIRPGTITLALLDPSIAIPTANLAEGASFLKRDGSVTLTGNLNAGGNRITGGAAGVAATDFVTVAQLQAVQNGTRLHFARLLNNANLALSGLPTVDGVTASDGDIVLNIAQTTGSQNGPWAVHSGAWTRPPDWASGAAVTEGHYWIIDPDGTAFKNTKWFLTNTAAITVDTTALTFQQDLSGTAYAFTGGLTQSGNNVTAARGNGVGLDGSNALTVTPDPSRLLQTIAAGVGIKDGTAGQIIVANASGNAAWVSASGDVTASATGVLTVNHTAGTGFLKYTDVVSNEVPSGTVNGSNTSFTLANTPQNSSLELFLDGFILKPGAGNDYTISGATITMLSAPLSGSQLLAFYVK